MELKNTVTVAMLSILRAATSFDHSVAFLTQLSCIEESSKLITRIKREADAVSLRYSMSLSAD